jgi:predicted enzyme related to lactoylglutathione lyase
VAAFYAEALGGKVLREDEHHTLVDWDGFHLVVHQIPAEHSGGVEVRTPPERRERASLRMDYPISNVPEARAAAARLGGKIDEAPPPWKRDGSFFLGHDPEGNVFGAKAG